MGKGTYLQKEFIKGKYFLYKRIIFHGDGDCLFWAVLKQIQFEHEIQKFIFTPDYLCRMIAVHYMKHKDDNEKELFYAVRKSLFAYSLPAVEGEEDRPRPFTIKEYFQYIIKENPGEMLSVCF